MSKRTAWEKPVVLFLPLVFNLADDEQRKEKKGARVDEGAPERQCYISKIYPAHLSLLSNALSAPLWKSGILCHSLRCS